MVVNVFNCLDMQKEKNVPIQSRKNCMTVLGMDPLLSEKIKFNTLSNKKNTEGGLPWNKSQELREWTNIDTEYLICYMETFYLLNSDKKILAALEMTADINKFNPFVDMLNNTQWDGICRIENLLTDYLGVEKSRYSTECLKLLMLAVISRAFNPGTKFDYVLVLSGAQGIGKSSFFMKLCCNEEWYLENLRTIDRGKEAAELIQGKLIVEFNELLAIKGCIEGIKSFVTLTSDEYRGAYARESEKRKRTCAFVGTTNEEQYLTDKTGNRRFLPLKCGIVPITKSLFTDENKLKYEFMQAWAEAYQIYKSGKFTLVLPPDLKEYVEEFQEDFKEDDPMVGMIEKWLKDEKITCTCNLQIAKEVFHVDEPDRKFIKRIAAVMLNDIKGWKQDKKCTFKFYGRQRCYVKNVDFEDYQEQELPFD